MLFVGLTISMLSMFNAETDRIVFALNDNDMVLPIVMLLVQ